MQTQNTTITRQVRVWCAIGAAAAAMGVAVSAHADMKTSTAGPFTYVCGGVAADEQAEMRSEASQYDMGLLFTQGGRGEYLSDVNVKLMRNGQQVAEFTSTGPRCLIKGPRASYQVVATYEGTSKRTTVSPGEKNVQMRW
ncbi:hypothetical protein SAMN04488595_10736 [Ralstonia sp. 25mfcol4.1]|uniref:hypothetical protein n=1 Tax=Burkholderiaceae TaxID=119060 RepID=UPI0003F5A07D|nr:hypothetical protein [Ralstonia sp. 25mfcol4.1]SDP31066.1 hypothetical protein SAMN04488595_10736 [Ralstonia sp. 25mfcol4.1]